MIKTRKDLKKYLSIERKLYTSNSRWRSWIAFLLYGRNYIYKYIRLLRYTEYYYNNSYRKTGSKKGLLNELFYSIYNKRRNKLGSKLGIEIGLNCCEEGLLIYHAGFIVINYKAHIGKNCRLHGCNCIGNGTSGVPTIGNNVVFGVGSSVIGGITIANSIKIGAGAVVTKSFETPNITIVGIPAK
jgi:hypothetical protein